LSDFIIQLGSGIGAERVAQLLRDRPGMADAPVHTYCFPWGSVVLQEPRGRGYVPLHEDAELFCCVGRPRFVGVTHEDRGPDGFNRIFAERWRRGDRKALSDALTGMFVLARCHDSGVEVLTDQMGFRPVYVASNLTRELSAVGSHIDTVADAASNATDFDLASLGELLVYQHITFPYTTRKNVRELDPASLHSFRTEHTGFHKNTVTFWVPREPAVFAPKHELVEQLEDALRFAGHDISRGAETVAVMLSGGRDSRAVLAVLPRDRCVAAVTFFTRENREFRVARIVAEKHGVVHYGAQRHPEFYAKLVDRGIRLLGSELRADAHGYAIVDNALDKRVDLIVGGFLSDTLLKDHFMSRQQKKILRRKGWGERLKDRLIALRLHPPRRARAGKPHEFFLRMRLCPDIRDDVADRRSVRLGQVAARRPETANEWCYFWPASRQHDMSFALGNSRLFCADELFMHRRIVDLAASLPNTLRYAGQVANAAFARVYGSLGSIVDANTGAPAAAALPLKGLAAKRRRRQCSTTTHATTGEDPWNDVDHSWVDFESLQRYSAAWNSYRRRLLAAGRSILEEVLLPDPAIYFESYVARDGVTFNRLAVQLGAYTLAFRRRACAGSVYAP